MNGKKDGPGKEPPRGTDPAAPKRPHAVIDLKATEVERKDPKPDTPSTVQAGAGKAGAVASEPPKSAAGSVPPIDLKSAQSKPADVAKPADVSKPDPTKPEPAKPEAAKPAAAATAAGTKPSGPGLKSQGYSEPKPASGSSFGSTVSHLAAGALGGMLALLAADAFAPQLSQSIGWPRVPAATSDASTKLQDRLAALERSVKDTAPNPDLAKRLAAIDAKAQELDQLSKSVATLNQAQAALAADAKAMAEKQARPGTEADSARIAALEERLAVLAAAAANYPDKGRIPQLAAITGKLSDLEAALSTQMAQVRAAMPREIEARLSEIASTSEAAKSGASRVDRDLAGVKTDIGRLGQRTEGLKAEDERIAQNVRAVQEETGALRSTVDALKGDLKSAAKPADISSALGPVSTKLAALEGTLQQVVKSEDERKTNAERVVISLGLADLKRSIERGDSYAAELAEVRKVAGSKLDLAPLERFKTDGVPTIAELTAEFRPLLHAIIDADSEPADATVMDRLIAGAKSVVRVRKVSHTPDDASAEAIVARMESALKDGRLDEVLAQAKALPQKASVPAQAWLGKVESRSAVDRAMASIEAQLKDSLAGTPASPAGKASN